MPKTFFDATEVWILPAPSSLLPVEWNSSTCFAEIVYFKGNKMGKRDVFYCKLQLSPAKYCRQWSQIVSLTDPNVDSLPDIGLIWKCRRWNQAGTLKVMVPEPTTKKESATWHSPSGCYPKAGRRKTACFSVVHTRACRWVCAHMILLCHCEQHEKHQAFEPSVPKNRAVHPAGA